MTIEEYLKKSAEELENTIPKGDNCDGNIYLEGKRDAYREILEKLPKFEHETTLREFKEFCRSQEKCSACPVVDQCRFDCPRIWDLEEMDRRRRWQEERRIREARDDND